MNADENARTFAMRIIDGRERLLDQSTAGDLSVGQQAREFDDGHGVDLVTRRRIASRRESGAVRCMPWLGLAWFGLAFRVLVMTLPPGPCSLRPSGARSSHWYAPHRPSSPRAYVEYVW